MGASANMGNKRGWGWHVCQVGMGAGASAWNERGCAEQVHGIKGGAGGRRVYGMGAGAGAGVWNGHGCKHGEWVGVQPQMAAFRITTDSAKRPRIEPKKLFFGGTGIRGPTQKWGCGAPHKFFGSACGGRGSPLERSVGSPTSSFCKMWAAPPQMWAAPLGVGLPMKLGNELTLRVPKKGSLRNIFAAKIKPKPMWDYMFYVQRALVTNNTRKPVSRLSEQTGLPSRQTGLGFDLHPNPSPSPNKPVVMLFPGSVDVLDEEHLVSAGGFGARGSVDENKEDGVEVGVSDVFPDPIDMIAQDALKDSGVAVVDFSAFLDGSNKQDVADSISSSFKKAGLVYIHSTTEFHPNRSRRYSTHREEHCPTQRSPSKCTPQDRW
ncbi:hypothetical protein DFH08DRAFT_827939 [Mycena albidolilacea]|uniref:Uncharacterized protein n=1 Tax=Mycena albidolilacea TaxID=1033008 RepID=A0AAD6YX73_9AGAR|nr:hypothetical protein DFH08DRAFT_827939 [Mycena albidolilacea]